MTTLISFLGTGLKDQNGKSRGYQETTYRLDGVDYPQKYVSISLIKAIKPNKVILLGTTGSVWDVFLENGGDSGLEQEWLSLSEKVEEVRVTKQDLEPFELYLSEQYQAQVKCVLIPYARKLAEQVEVLSVIAENLADNENVVLDVTHGFRHLPMLALVASRFLKTIKNINVQNIYYGAFDMKDEDGTCPIIDVNGMLSMLDWIDALNTFDKDGDYGVFFELLVKEGIEQSSADLLRQASFYERTTNASNAKQKLDTIFKELNAFDDSPLFNLFKPQLTKRLQWFKKSNRGLREQELAKEYLNRRDYVRAVVFAMEGMISAKVFSEKQDENRYEDREEARSTLREADGFKFLSNIRNALVHGLGNQNKDIKRVLDKESSIQQSLKKRFSNLLDNKK